VIATNEFLEDKLQYRDKNDPIEVVEEETTKEE